MAAPTTPEGVLKRYWGYDAFRPVQRDIIDAVLQGHDTLGLLPTGGGKSITFQVPAMLLPGVTVVVTPLISLMKDQVDNLTRVGIPARCIHTGLTPRENGLTMDKCRHGACKLLYLSPEKLQGQSFMTELARLNVSLIVVDEAHCISQWGYDFRPSYLRIGEMRRAFDGVPVLALTASATPEVAADICNKLGFSHGYRTYSRSFRRDNLSFVVRHDEEKSRTLIRVLAATQGSAIVYVRSRRKTRELADTLSAAGISADAYHAGLAASDKSERQNRWKAGEVRVMVATNAFGMGIDKADVRTVVHVDLPSSLEEYYQEAGRAGRDGLPAYAVVITGPRDNATLSRRLADAFPDKQFIGRVYELAGAFTEVSVGTRATPVTPFAFDRFCDTYGLPPRPVLSALQLLTRAGHFEYVDELETRGRVMIIMDRREIYNVEVDRATEELFWLLTRIYTGLYADYVPINEGRLAFEARMSEHEVYESLMKLTRLGVLHYIPVRRSPYLYWIRGREQTRYITMPLEIYERQRERMAHRIDAVKRFVNTTDECRESVMLRYFGEEPQGDCGRCDNCRTARRQGHAKRGDFRQTLLDGLGTAPVPVETVLARYPDRRDETLATLRTLAAQGHLSIDIPAGTVRRL